MVDIPSWRDTIRASALSGLAALADKRALDLGFKYAAAGNPGSLRASALAVLGANGKDDPRTFTTIATALNEGFERRNFALAFGAAEALVTLGDERGLPLLQELSKKAAISPQVVAAISAYETRLRAKLAPSKPGS